MKNINFFLLISLFVAMQNPCSYGIFRNEMILMNRALTGSATIFSEGLVKAAPIVGVDAANVVAVGAVEASQVLGTSGVEAAKIGAQSIDKLAVVGQGLVAVAGVGTCIFAAVKVYEIGKDINALLNPTEEQKERKIKARESRKLIEARVNFRDCLMKNHRLEKNQSGRPTVCEDMAKMFALIGGQAALDEMTQTFVGAYGK